MFCIKCGTKMEDTDKFCPNCGTPTNQNPVPKKEKIEDNEIKYTLKPSFNVGYKLITTIFGVVLYTLIILFCLGLWALLVFPIIRIIILAIMVLCVLIKLIFNKKQYDYLEYDFYNTKIEYRDGFLNKEEKELKYKYVREVAMNQNILERAFNIGTIRIYTNASSGYVNGKNMSARNGIYIHCVENVKERYEEIKKIIDEGTSAE